MRQCSSCQPRHLEDVRKFDTYWKLYYKRIWNDRNSRNVGGTGDYSIKRGDRGPETERFLPLPYVDFKWRSGNQKWAHERRKQETLREQGGKNDRTHVIWEWEGKYGRQKGRRRTEAGKGENGVWVGQRKLNISKNDKPETKSIAKY